MELTTQERRIAALDHAAEKFTFDMELGYHVNSATGKVYDNANSDGQILLYTPIRRITAQQVVWFAETGLDPNEKGARIIHLDGNTTNNRPENLKRVIGPYIGRKGYANSNTEDYAGVTFCARTGKYRATFTYKEKINYIGGNFETAFEAGAARDEAIRGYFDGMYINFPTTIAEVIK